MLNIVSHSILGKSRKSAGLYGYVMAGDGVYVAAEKPHLSALIKIGECEVRGLPCLEGSEFSWSLPKVSTHIVKRIYTQSLLARDGNSPIEILFHLVYECDDWVLYTPGQTQGVNFCRPLDDCPGSTYDRSQIEIHSHHAMKAQFSSIDNADETNFKIYAVLGNIFEKPTIKVRIGLYGYFADIPADAIFELPEYIIYE